MGRFTIKLSGFVIEINSIYDYTEKMCKDYIVNDKPDFSITISEEDITFEREKSKAENLKEGLPVVDYKAEYLESLSVYRKITSALLDKDIILFHGSVICLDGVGYLFTAKSGTGKSTHTKLWREYYGDRVYMVNDDKPLIKITEEGALVYGTPWDGKHRLSTNTCVRLKAICVLERGENNTICKVEAGEIYPMILQQTNRPAGQVNMIKTLGLIDKLCKAVKFYKLKCNMNIEAAKVASEYMRED